MANGGLSSSGIFEARDVVGSLNYVRGRRDTREMAIGLFSRCLGASSTFSAMTQFPEAFDGVRYLVAPQPVTARTIMERRLAGMGLSEHIDEFERMIIVRTGIGFARRNPREWAKNVRVPTFLYGVHDDALTEPADVQTMFDNIPIAEKKLQWIWGTTSRWDGYVGSSAARSRCSSGLSGTCTDPSSGLRGRGAIRLPPGAAENPTKTDKGRSR